MKFMKNIFLLLFLIVFSCSKIEEVKDKTVQKVKNKASTTTEVLWKKGVDILFQNTTSINTIRFENIYPQRVEFEIKNQEGLKIDFLGGFYQCFFKYKSDKNELFNFLNNLETTHPDISNKEILSTNNEMIVEKLNFIKIKFPEIYKQLVFFIDFENKEELEYYSIGKYPYYNLIIYDKLNDYFYHFVENYQD
ncbi:hypothetical protein OBK02_02150 [Empedobacter falsenii]